MIRFQPRDRRPVATLGLDDLAVGERADGEVIELVRAQETELPQALKWQVLNAEEDYDAMTVEARRATGEALRVTSESFAIATDRQRRRPALPSYWLVQASHVGLGQPGWGSHGWVVMTLWTIALVALAGRAYQLDTGRNA